VPLSRYSRHQGRRRLNEALAVPINISATTTLLCTASIGYADTRTSGNDSAALLAAADAAMYQVKKARITPTEPVLTSATPS